MNDAAGAQVTDGYPDDLLCRDQAIDHVKRPSGWGRRPIRRRFVSMRLAEQDDRLRQLAHHPPPDPVRDAGAALPDDRS